MKFDACPLCGGSVSVGSHWDCLFAMMADWMQFKPREQEKPDLGPRPQEGEGEDG